MISKTQHGLILAIAAYSIWGLFPIYFKALDHMEPLSVLCYRIIYSFLIISVFVINKNDLAKIGKILKNAKKMKYLFVSSALISLTWLTYIWAINNDRILEAALGYLINPLLNVLFGILFFKEKFNAGQKLAIFIAVAAVGLEIISYGTFPVVSLILGLSFTLYAIVRKQILVEAKPGLFVETMFMIIPALVFLTLLAPRADLPGGQSTLINALLVFGGVITTLPLLFFVDAAKKLKLSVLGLIQYIDPTLGMLLAIFVYKETITNPQTFVLVWLSILIFVVSGRLRSSRTGA